MLTHTMTEIVTVSTDASIKIWDLEVGTCKKTLEFTSPLTAVHPIGDSDRILTLSTDNTAAVWDLPTCKLLFRLAHPEGTTITSVHIHPRVRTPPLHL